jgi:hypothetical protein
MSFRGPSEARQSGTPEHRPLEHGFRARRYAASRNDDITGYLVQSRLGALRAGARESITDQDQTIETPRFRDRKTGNYRTAQAVGQVFRHRLGSGTNGPATWVHGMFRSRSWPPLGHPSVVSIRLSCEPYRRGHCIMNRIALDTVVLVAAINGMASFASVVAQQEPAPVPRSGCCGIRPWSSGMMGTE